MFHLVNAKDTMKFEVLIQGSCKLPGTVFGLSQTFGAAGSLAASYFVKEGLHGSVSVLCVKENSFILIVNVLLITLIVMLQL
jgi:hypothetical protein